MEAELDTADLYNASLIEANLIGAKLNKANLNGASFWKAKLNQAELSSANLNWTNLYNADLKGAIMDGAQLAYADLTHAIYAPAASKPPDSYVAGIRGLTTVSFPRGEESGLFQLRGLFQNAGLRDLERQATFALEQGRIWHAITDWKARPARRPGYPSFCGIRDYDRLWPASCTGAGHNRCPMGAADPGLLLGCLAHA